MEQIRSARALKFGTEVIVEVQGTDEHGAVDVISYQFALDDDGRGLTPKEPVADEHVSIVRDALTADEFSWVPEQTRSR